MKRSRQQAGFTLVEALIAMVVLVFGLIAVTNLFVVGGSSNQTANHSTAATTQATEVMEALKAIPFDQLFAATGGNLAADAGAACVPDCLGDPTLCPSQCVVPGNFNYYRDVPGVGPIVTRWLIQNPAAGGADTLFITVRSESMAPLVGGVRSRAEFTTFRTCLAGPPAC